MKKYLLSIMLAMGTGITMAQTCPVDFLGPDRVETVCSNEFVNLESYFENLSSYPSVVWSPGGIDPQSAPPGSYNVVVVDAEGCVDDVQITINANPAPEALNDTIVRICEGQTKDLYGIFTLPPGYFIDFDAPDPAAATGGTYTATVQDNNLCIFNAMVIVEEIPVVAPVSLSLTLYNMSTPPLPTAFTTNSFRCITSDHQGNIWAGTNGGGLYFFDKVTWHKTRQGDNKYYRDLAAIKTFADGPRIWAASVGDNTTDATGGGVYYVQGENFSTRLYSNIKYKRVCPRIDDVFVVRDSSGGLLSRSVNSLVLSDNNQLYAAMGQVVELDTSCLDLNQLRIQEGGISQYDVVLKPERFKTVEGLDLPQEDIRCSAAGQRSTAVWFGVQRSCPASGVCQEPEIIKWNTVLNAPAGFVRSSNSPLPFNKPSQPVVRSIFTDSRNRTFVAFSQGEGFGVLDENNVWHMVTNDISKLPLGASVNFNAITEANNGRVLFGTSAGLLEYLGSGSFTLCSSYTLYTTANGLPSDNITDVAYSTFDQQIWMATDAGVCSVGDRVRTIRGQVMNVYCGKEGNITPELKGKPIVNAEVRLYAGNGDLRDFVTTDADGNFEITEGESGINYKVQVKYIAPGGKVYIYEYPNVKYDELIGFVPIPDSLLKDIDAYYPKLVQECPDLGLPFGFKIPLCLDVFNMVSAISLVYGFPEIVSDNHVKRVNNLVAYYFTLVGIETATKNVAKYGAESGVSILDGIEAVLKNADINVKWKMYGSTSNSGADKKAKKISEAFALGAEVILNIIRTAKTYFISNGDEAAYAYLKRSEDVVKGFAEIASKVIIDQSLINGASTAIQGMGVDLFKKLIGIGVSKIFLLDLSRQMQTKLNESALLSIGHHSDLNYQELYDNIITNDGRTAVLDSLANLRITTITGIEFFRAAAKIAEWVQKLGPVAKAFGRLTGPVTAVLLEVASEAAKVAQPAAHFAASFTAVAGISKTEFVANKVFPSTELISTRPLPIHSNLQVVQYQMDPLLLEKKNQSNQALLQLKNIVLLNDTVNYFVKLDTVFLKDSLLSRSFIANNNTLEPYLANAYRSIPSFQNEYEHFADQNYCRRHQYQIALYHLLFAYEINNFNTATAAKITTTIDTLIALNDSAYLGLDRMKTLVNNASISATSFVVVDSIIYNYVRQPAKPGTVTFYYKNIGTQITNGFYVKFIGDSLLQLNSVDSVFIGQILPGETKAITYNFITPLIDTSVSFEIISQAANGLYSDAYGIINAFTKNGRSFTLKPGNWSDPATWSTDEVPSSITEVYILHPVNVDMHAECKTLSAEQPGNLTVNTGQSLKVYK